MRAGEHYRCERCGRGGGLADLCERRCVHARDSRGNAPCPPHREEYEWYRGDPTLAGTLLVRSAFLLATALRRRRRRKQLRALFAAAGPTVPLAAATDGLVAFEGRVEVLEPVLALGGDPVAAYLHHAVQAERVKRSGASVLVERVTRLRGAGRFFVRDETGVALVDDDWVLLLDEDGVELPDGEDGTLRVEDGQRVRVVGHGARGGFFDPASDGSFRGRVRGFEMIGGTGRPVCVTPIR